MLEGGSPKLCQAFLTVARLGVGEGCFMGSGDHQGVPVGRAETKSGVPSHSAGLLWPCWPLWSLLELSLFTCRAVCCREGQADWEAPGPITRVSSPVKQC